MYDRYLQVWDLCQKGMTIEGIAKELYPREYGAQQDYRGGPPPREAFQEKYEQRLKQLIAEGVKESDAHNQAEKEFILHRNPRLYKPIVQKVRDHYDRANDLIKGGYKELR